jgi:hypothetical protein
MLTRLVVFSQIFVLGVAAILPLAFRNSFWLPTDKKSTLKSANVIQTNGTLPVPGNGTKLGDFLHVLTGQAALLSDDCCESGVSFLDYSQQMEIFNDNCDDERNNDKTQRCSNVDHTRHSGYTEGAIVESMLVVSQSLNKVFSYLGGQTADSMWTGASSTGFGPQTSPVPRGFDPSQLSSQEIDRIQAILSDPLLQSEELKRKAKATHSDIDAHLVHRYLVASGWDKSYNGKRYH